MAKKKKADVMFFWVALGFAKSNDWDHNPKKPMRTESWCNYLYDNYWEEMAAEGLTRNDVFYAMRFPMNRLKKKLGIK